MPPHAAPYRDLHTPARGARDELAKVNESLVDDPPTLELGPAPAPEALFDGRPRSEEAFGGALGLCRGPALPPDERSRLEALIHEHLVDRARALSRTAAADVRAVALQRYHEVADRLDHRPLLSKRGRIMSAEAVAEIKAMSVFDYARRAFGEECRLSDEEGVGCEQICLRLVRPDRREDVGTLHADAWFWEHYGWTPPPGVCRAKMWLGVCVDPARNGLLIAPGSHRRRAPYRVTDEGGKVGFAPDFDLRTLDLRRFEGAPGEPILFNYRTLHVGSLNRAETTRVSIEATVLFRAAPSLLLTEERERNASAPPPHTDRASCETASPAFR